MHCPHRLHRLTVRVFERGGIERREERQKRRWWPDSTNHPAIVALNYGIARGGERDIFSPFQHGLARHGWHEQHG